MSEPRVSFDEIEDGVATFVLYKDDSRELLLYPVDELPEGAEREHLFGQFRPEFDDNGEIVALHYDQELTEREHEKAQSIIEKYQDTTDDSE